MAPSKRCLKCDDDISGSMKVKSKSRRPENYLTDDWVEVDDDEDDGHFPHLLHREFPLMNIMKPSERSRLRERGFKIRDGAFSEREKKRAILNFDTQMNSEPICSFWGSQEEYNELVLVLTSQYTKVETAMDVKLEQILGPKNKADPLSCPQRMFWFEVCRGLPYRSLKCVQYFLRKALNPFRKATELSDEEIHTVLELKRKGIRQDELSYEHKVKSMHIVYMIQSKLTPDLQFAKMTPFTLEEDRRLVRAVKKKLGIKKLIEWNESMSRHGVDWRFIASQMPGRSISSVRTRFDSKLLLSRFTPYMELVEKKKKHFRADRKKLSFFLFKGLRDGMDSEDDIDWAFLRCKMNHLMFHDAMSVYNDLMAKIPDEITDYEEKIDWLYENMVLPLTKDEEKELEDWYNAPVTFS